MSSCMREDILDPGAGSSDPSTDVQMPITVSASTISHSGVKSTLIWDLDGLKNSGHDISFHAYANFEGNSTLTSILDNARLHWTGSSWTYQPLQYWKLTADSYHFSAIHPYAQGRLSPSFTYPTGDDEYLLGLQPKVYPMYERWAAEDYAQGAIVYKVSKNLYLTTSMDDIMFGEANVLPSQYGSDVNIPLEHAGTAVRFRIRNLSDSPFALTNWYMTGLKNHCDMVIHVLDCPDQYDPLRCMTVVPDQKISEVKVTSFGQSDAKDSVKFVGSSDWVICADGGVSPGHDDYYKYVVLSSRMKEVGATYGLTHTHSEDGLTITYYDGTGASWTDPKKFMAESQKYKDAVAAIQTIYQYTFPNYGKNIFWGPAHYLDADNFFIPFVYEYGAQIMDFDFDQERGDADDYALKIHQFECRSHMYPKDNPIHANGGLYLPVSGDNYAVLYSPYFFSAESHTTVTGDWKEGMGDATTTPHTPYRWNDDDSDYNVNENGKQRSVFLWTADNVNPTTPMDVETCIEHFNAGDKQYTASVAGGDLANTLNDWGYLLLYPQKIDSLEFHFFTSKDIKATGDPATAEYSGTPVHHSFNLKKYTPGGEWLSGYNYDYTITVSSSDILMRVDVEPWNEREIDLD